MKKSLLALAALSAFATAAQAQSSVTVYGIADVNYTSTDGAASDTAQSGSGLTTSRLGFRGTEDLGGGLKANFQLESKLDFTTGQQGASNAADTAAKTFDRESCVGLESATLGSLRVGLRDITDAVNIDAITSQAGNLGLIAKMKGNDVAKGVRYTTPTISGFSAQIGYSNATSTPTAEVTNGAVKSYFASYTAGNLGLYAGMESTKIAVDYDQDQTIYGGTYDFGFAKVGATFSTADGSTLSTKSADEVKSTRISVAAPVAALGSGVSVHVVYFKDKTGDGSAATNTTTTAINDNDGYTLALTKALSKRTTVYAYYKDLDNTLSSVQDTKTTGLGLRHSF